jgi:hypothetical protein
MQQFFEIVLRFQPLWDLVPINQSVNLGEITRLPLTVPAGKLNSSRDIAAFFEYQNSRVDPVYEFVPRKKCGVFCICQTTLFGASIFRSCKCKDVRRDDSCSAVGQED